MDCSNCAAGFFATAAPSSWGWGEGGETCVPIASLVAATTGSFIANEDEYREVVMSPTPPDGQQASRRSGVSWWVILLSVLVALLVCGVGVVCFIARDSLCLGEKSKAQKNKDEQAARQLESVETGSRVPLVPNPALFSTGTASPPQSAQNATDGKADGAMEGLVHNSGEPSRHSNSGLLAPGEQVSVSMNRDQSQPGAYSGEIVPASARVASTGSLQSAVSGSEQTSMYSATMNSMLSTPRMPHSMVSTLPNAPFDTLRNCTAGSNSAVLSDAVAPVPTKQGDPAEEPNAWFANNLNAPSEVESESMFGNTFNAASALGRGPLPLGGPSSSDNSMQAAPGSERASVIDKSLLTPPDMQTDFTSFPENYSQSLMSLQHDSASLMSPPKAGSPADGNSTLLPNTAALQAEYQSSFYEDPSSMRGMRMGRGQMAGWGRGGRFGVKGAADQSGYSAQLSTLDQRSGELQMESLPDGEGNRAAAFSKHQGRSMQEILESLHTDQRAQVRAEQRARSQNISPSSSPTGSKSPQRRASTLLQPTVSSNARNRATSFPKHNLSTPFTINNPAYAASEPPSQSRQAQYLAQASSEPSSSGPLEGHLEDAEAHLQQPMHGRRTPGDVGHRGLMPGPVEENPGLSMPLAGVTSEMSGLVTDQVHTNELFAAYGGSTQLNAADEGNSGKLVSIQSFTEGEEGTGPVIRNISRAQMAASPADASLAHNRYVPTDFSADVSRDFAADTTAELSRSLVGNTTFDVSRDLVPDTTAEISMAFPGDTTALISRTLAPGVGATADFSRHMQPCATANIAVGETAGFTEDLTALLDSGSIPTEGADTQQEDVTARIPWVDDTLRSSPRGSGHMQSESSGSDTVSMHSCSSLLPPTSAGPFRAATNDLSQTGETFRDEDTEALVNRAVLDDLSLIHI